MNSSRMPESFDEAARRLEIIEGMEAKFLQELSRAGANVPARSTVTTALLRGLLWDRREDDLLTRGHTAIETQVVKNSRRSALLQLVAQIWKIPKPEYEKVDAILAASANEAMRNANPSLTSPASFHPSQQPPSPSHSTHHSQHTAFKGHHHPRASPISDSIDITHSDLNRSIEANPGKSRASLPSSIGSSAEFEAYEALSSLSSTDAMAVDEPDSRLPPLPPFSSSWKPDSAVGLAKDDRHALRRERTERDSIGAVIFRSSPQLTALKYTRSSNNTSPSHASTTSTPSHTTTDAHPSTNRFFKSSRSGAASPANSSSCSPFVTSSSSFSSKFATGNAMSSKNASASPHSIGSPRSPASSPSSSAFTPLADPQSPNTSSQRAHNERFQSSFNPSNALSSSLDQDRPNFISTSTSSSSRSKFPLPIDLKSLIPNRESQSGSPSSMLSMDDNPLSEAVSNGSARNTGGTSLRSPSSFAKPSGIATPSSYGWPGSPTSSSLTNPLGAQPSAGFSGQAMSMGSGTMGGSTGGSFSDSPFLHSPSPLNQSSMLANPYPTVPAAHHLDPRISMPPAAMLSATDHIPVWVPRTTPLMPLVLCPVRSPQGEWFYTYHPISYPDMSVILAGSAANCGSPPLGHQPR